LIARNKSSTYAVESVHKSLPNFDVASALALVVEAINTSDIRTLMITSEQKEVLRILDLVAPE
jgi:arginine/lysine/ornithine decarboxylase